ncbi:methylated-DNA--[protein]-cysteine S-methyltransferase [Vagococcus carniphilus]|uniref:methylated-DNA--[protein]-cysteine S-methyltransferase n=1 Tax=Vagococcus carniphilus TaxID=218144 RepID=UPI00288EA2E5|nr:methylated-DNA--[protein]-cysteine S-methyltransferase [Vagococcus carniphilus]MDT2831585.1 methylated-DNA--[protein]-cysteine S-methyltransferase [Vagococcus carniphilus]MDT2840507.1 methylated-DNA--[protein]-cysteine S-methyltransferase [Vagococcus carniphilus]MDT2855165.1 methylated-DNA--[protein]-cysteine S-methyltransferase [Vagococcus carniphilus]
MYLEYGPIKIWLEADEVGITNISFVKEKPKDVPLTPLMEQHLNLAQKELMAYFNGDLISFNVPLHFTCGTDFQQNVWQELQKIPYGQFRNYQDVAIAVNSPKAQRAVGQANRRNPIPIIVPCHRVIGKNGTLTGYSGSGEEGLVIKKFLLNLEQLKKIGD